MEGQQSANFWFGAHETVKLLREPLCMLEEHLCETRTDEVSHVLKPYETSSRYACDSFVNRRIPQAPVGGRLRANNCIRRPRGGASS
jgi:hypothetical protein